MSDAFDPYYIWLGIPPEEQPPHHYRLFGVTLFEENSEVIEAAANRQMAYIQEISAGDDHIDQAQKILGQLSQARVCLLNSEKKAAYDAKLLTSFDSLAPVPETQGPKPAASSVPLMPPQIGKSTPNRPATGGDSPAAAKPKPQQSGTSADSRTKTKKRKSVLWVALPTVVGLAAIIYFTWQFVDNQAAERNEEARNAEIARVEAVRRAQIAEEDAKQATSRLEAMGRKEQEQREAARRQREEEAKEREQAEAAHKETAEAKKKAAEAEVKKKAEAAEAAKKQAKEAEAAKKQAEAHAKKQADKYIKSKGFTFNEENGRWWPEASYSQYEEVKQLAEMLQQDDLYTKNRKQFWSKVRELLDKREQIQAALDAANEPEFTTQLEILGQKPGELPEISWLKGTATSFLQDQGLKEADNNEWLLEEEAQLKAAKDAESNLSAEMLAKFNPAQRQLIDIALKQYQTATKKEFDDLYNSSVTAEGIALNQSDINSKRGGKGWGRFNFLAWHHPDTDATKFGIPKKETTPFEREALEASLKRLQNTSAWQKASRKRSKANTLQKKISKKYKKLQRSIGVEVALEIVDGKLPSTATNK